MNALGGARAAGSGALLELKTNPRLRWGVWLIAAILWLYVALEMRDASRRQVERYATTARQVEMARAALAQSDWKTRLEDVRALQSQLERRLWREGTLGLAQASFQDWLNVAAQQNTLSRVSIVVAAQEDPGARGDMPGGRETVASQPPLWKVSARMSFDFDPRTLYPFLARIATSERGVFVESLVIRGTPLRVEMGLVAYFQRSPDAQAAPAAARGSQ